MTVHRFQPGWRVRSGDTFRALLHERGVTQQDLAIRAGISTAHLSRLISGEAGASRPVAASVAEAFQDGVITLDLLFTAPGVSIRDCQPSQAQGVGSSWEA